MIGLLILVAALAYGPHASAANFSDPFGPLDADRHEGAPLNGLAAPDKTTWGALPVVVLRSDGAATVTPGTTGNAWVMLPPATLSAPSTVPITVEADVDPSNTEWTSIGLGGEGNNYWATDQIYAILRPAGVCQVFIKNTLIGQGSASSFVKGGFNHMKLTYAQQTNTIQVWLDGESIPTKVTPDSVGYMADIKSASFYFFSSGPRTAGVNGPAIKNFVVSGETPVHLQLPTLTPTSPASFFVGPAQTADMKFTVAAIPAVSSLHYTITSYDGTQVDSGVQSVSADGHFSVPVKLAQGYYDLTVKEARQTFGIDALPTHSGAADPFFGMDAGLSWLELDPNLRVAMISDMHRVGIDIARERFSWNSYNPKPGVFNTTERHFDEIRSTYQQSGVKVLELLFGSPGFTGPGAELKRNPFPSKWPESSQSAKGLANRLKNSWGAVEVWNEPDYDTRANLPADQYVPLVKAVAYGLAEAGVTVPVGGGVFAVCNRPYITQCINNGMLDDVDFVSFHNYGAAPSVEGAVEDYRKLLKEGGRESMPLWLTESGWPWKSGPDRPPLAEDQDSALEITAKAVEAKACGIAAFFPFVLPYYVEPGKSFSMLGKEVTPLRSLAAYAEAIRTLSNAQYIGDVSFADPAVKRARAFTTESGSTVVCIYAAGAAAGHQITLPFHAARAEGIDGRALNTTTDNKVAVSDGLIYVWPDQRIPASLIQRNTKAASLWAISRTPLPKRPAPSPIIMSYTVNDTVAQASTAGYQVNRDSAQAFPIKLKISNLSGSVENLSIAVSAPGVSNQITPVQQYSVPASSSIVSNWTVNVAAFLATKPSSALTFTSTDSVGDKSVVSIELSMDRDLSDYLKIYPASERIDLSDLTKWHKNAKGTSEFTSVAGGGWTMTTTYTGAHDNWTVPHFDLSQVINPATTLGLIVRARASTDCMNLINLVESQPGGIYGAPMPMIPADNQWHTKFIPISAFVASQSGPADPDWKLDLDQVKSIQIGQAGHANPQTIEVSDLYLAEQNAK